MAATISVKHLLFLLALFLSTLASHSTDFKIDWYLPQYKNEIDYYSWAASEQFYVGDTISFKYELASLMVVSRGEYLNCAPSNPILFSRGTTTYRFNRPDIFYFISGERYHCNYGQRMKIEVKEGLAPLPATSVGALSSSPLPLVVLAVWNVAGLVLGSCCF